MAKLIGFLRNQMIHSTVTEQNAAALLLFSAIKTELFKIERVLPRFGQRQQTQVVSPCQYIVGKHILIQNTVIERLVLKLCSALFS